jgi:hypothetical protein
MSYRSRGLPQKTLLVCDLRPECRVMISKFGRPALVTFPKQFHRLYPLGVLRGVQAGVQRSYD